MPTEAYHYVKEFGEGIDRIFREQEANDAEIPTFRTDEFILKVTVPKVTEKIERWTEKAEREGCKLTKNHMVILKLMMEPASKDGLKRKIGGVILKTLVGKK